MHFNPISLLDRSTTEEGASVCVAQLGPLRLCFHQAKWGERSASKSASYVSYKEVMKNSVSKVKVTPEG